MTMRMRLLATATGASLLALIAACGGGSSTNNQSTVSANVPAPATNESAHAMPSGPFSQAEAQMNERMMAAVGSNASETWTRKMIEHHRGAIAMSQVLIDQGGDPEFVRMASEGSAKQQREITEMERILSAGISGGSGEANPFTPIEQRMHQAMLAANGANLTETWARKMIEHHQGAIDMSEALIRQGGDPQVVAMARRTADDQRREKAHLEAMLRGDGMPSAAAPAPSAASANSSAPASREPVAAPKATPAPRPPRRDQAAPPRASQPTPSPAPTPNCPPEHHAAGHC